MDPESQPRKTSPDRNPEHIRAMFARIAGRYDLANHSLSMGMDWLWRRTAVRVVRTWSPRTVLDVATGSGDLAIALQSGLPAAKITGADFCLPILLEAQKKGFARLVVGDGMRLPFDDGTFDAATVAFGLRNMADYPSAVREMLRVIRPGGHLLILDFSLPANPFLRSLYRFYLHRFLPTLAGGLTGNPDAYRYLCGSIEAFPSGKAMCDLLRSAGMNNPVPMPLTFGIVSIYHGTA